MGSSPIHSARLHAESREAGARVMAEHLGQAIQFRTLSYDDPARFDAAAFHALHAFLRQTYPKLHATLNREEVAEYSLLYTWPGTDPQLEPVLLLAHQDVVPAEDEAGWQHPPFSGCFADGAVWGRGAMDVKGALIAICEAIEQLIDEGFEPRRTVYLAFGHDEEVGGRYGAARIGELLLARGIKPLFISDEGGAILSGIVPGVAKPVALVGIAEKGYLSLELKVAQPGGHASMPPPHTAIGILSAAIRKLEDHPFPARVSGVSRQMLEWLAPEMPLAGRLAISTLRLTEPLVRRRLLANPGSAATLRTTTAVTMIHAGVKDNILPQNAAAVVNLRILPGESAQSVITQVRKVIDDERVRVSPSGSFHSEPSPVADTDSPGFRLVHEAIRQIAPDAVVAPCLVLGGTDSRHYIRLTPSVFRFNAMRLTAADLPTIHGNNERLTLENCALMVNFYVRLLQNATA